MKTSNCCKISDDDIKTKMRNLRTQYGKEMGKMKSSKVSGSGTGDIYLPTWKWFQSLNFLKDSISPVKTRPTPGVPQELVTLDDNENVEPSFVDEEGDELGNTKLLSQVQKQSKKHPKDLETEVLTKSLVLLENATNRKRPPDDDSEEIFGKHVAKSLKAITDKRSRELAKIKIQQVLFDVEFGVIDHHQSQCSSTYYQV